MGIPALIIIDMQHGIFMRKEYDGVAIYKEDELLLNINSLIKKAKKAGAPVIYILHMYKDFPMMEKGQPLWQVHPAIKPGLTDIIVEKHHADAFYRSLLHDTLIGLGVTDLVITGIQTAYCVDTTCRRAHSLGYSNILASDGHSALDGGILKAEQIIAHHNEVLGSQFASVMPACSIEFG